MTSLTTLQAQLATLNTTIEGLRLEIDTDTIHASVASDMLSNALLDHQELEDRIAKNIANTPSTNPFEELAKLQAISKKDPEAAAYYEYDMFCYKQDIKNLSNK